LRLKRRRDNLEKFLKKFLILATFSEIKIEAEKEK
jgi:hypothetical protein